jgi:hypothetical protein
MNSAARKPLNRLKFIDVSEFSNQNLPNKNKDWNLLDHEYFIGKVCLIVGAEMEIEVWRNYE